FFYCYVYHQNLHSFPTRRSSDLTCEYRLGYLWSRVYCASKAWIENWQRCHRRACGKPMGKLVDHMYSLWYYLNEREEPPTLGVRSEEHTSELQSRSDLVCRLLLE